MDNARMTHRFQCQCGTLQGEVSNPGQALRAVCYCKDCQAYGRLLGEPQRVLDAQGGTDIVATESRYVKFTAGMESLACLCLSPRGLLRWYAKCCNTPIANTPHDWKIPYAGLVHTCLRNPEPVERSFPQVQLRVNTGSALGRPPETHKLSGWARFGALMLRLTRSRLVGGYHATPFFDPHGKPVVEPIVAPRDAVDAARRGSGAQA
jgi:hypothetical protein